MTIESFHLNRVVKGQVEIAQYATLEELFEPLRANQTKVADLGIQDNGQDISNAFAPLSGGSRRVETNCYVRGDVSGTDTDLNDVFAAYGTSLNGTNFIYSRTGGVAGWPDAQFSEVSQDLTITPPGNTNEYTYIWSNLVVDQGPTPSNDFQWGSDGQSYTVAYTPGSLVGLSNGTVQCSISDQTTGETRIVSVPWNLTWDWS